MGRTQEGFGEPVKGKLDYKYGWKTEIHGLHGTLGYQWGIRGSLFGTVHLYDYGKFESNDRLKLPYRSAFEGELMFDYNIGMGVTFNAEGRYLGKRYSDGYWTEKLDPLFLLDIGLKKRIKNILQIEANAYNLFNEEYELWQTYLEPDIRAMGGLRFFF